MKFLYKYIFATLLLLSSSNIYGTECNVPMCVIIDRGFTNVPPEAVSVLETQLERLATQYNLNIGW